MTTTFEQEVNEMCDIGHGIAKKNYNNGFDNGILKNLLENIRSLIKNAGWTLEQSFNTLSVSQDDRQKIIEMMNNSQK